MQKFKDDVPLRCTINQNEPFVKRPSVKKLHIFGGVKPTVKYQAGEAIKMRNTARPRSQNL